MRDSEILSVLRDELWALDPAMDAASADIGALPTLVGDAQLVLIGEATHGSREFYQLRAALTRHLIEHMGFDGVAVEADWPDAWRASRYVQGHGDDASPEQALSGFERFPRWMWRNRQVADFIGWLREHNSARAGGRKPVGFYGLDVYSLRASMEAVLRYLSEADPEAAARARQRYSCFDHLADNPQGYGYATSFGLRGDCEREVMQQLLELTQRWERQLAEAGDTPDQLFYAQQNARVVRNAEAYYRAMFEDHVASWNVRDRHMVDTLVALKHHCGQGLGRPARLVVWAHNSHIGDARHTEMGEMGEVNLGQLAREREAELGKTFLLGMTTHTGAVTAASDWDAPAQHKAVRPSREDSFEGLLHALDEPAFILPLTGRPRVQHALERARLERAIGVIYLPESERRSHYFRAHLARQFDAVVHLDVTSAVQPLDEPAWAATPLKEAETYPSGL